MTLKKMPQDSISKALETVLAISPDNAGARLQLIQAEWGEQDFDRVAELSRQAIDYNPDEMAFYYFLGLAYVQKDDDDSALDALRRGVSQINNQSNKELVSDFYAIMGDILHDKGLAEEAYAAYDSCLQWKDDNLGCLNNYAYYLSEENRELAKAEQMSYRTVQAEPDNATFLDTYAWILFKRKKYAEAMQYINMAVDNDTAKKRRNNRACRRHTRRERRHRRGGKVLAAGIGGRSGERQGHQTQNKTQEICGRITASCTLE